MACSNQRAIAVPPHRCPSRLGQAAPSPTSSRACLPAGPAPCGRGWASNKSGGRSSRSHRHVAAAAAAATDSQGRGGEALAQSNYRCGPMRSANLISCCCLHLLAFLRKEGPPVATTAPAAASCLPPICLTPPPLPPIHPPPCSLFVRFLHLASPYVAGHRGRTFVITIPGEVGAAGCGPPLLPTGRHGTARHSTA